MAQVQGTGMGETRALGNSGLATAPLVLGGNVFGWTADEPTSFAVLDAFVAGGGTMIDTADVYTAQIPGNEGGESETVIGNWLQRRGKRDDVRIATKVAMLPPEGMDHAGLSAAVIEAAAEASLKRLRTDYIDLYFAHRDDFEGPLQRLCIAEDIGVVPYYGLASGFLTGKYRTEADLAGRPRADRVRTYLDDRGKAVLAAMDAVATETGASLPQIALAWIAAKPGLTAPIASATSVAQLEELLGAMTLALSADQIARLDAAGA